MTNEKVIDTLKFYREYLRSNSPRDTRTPPGVLRPSLGAAQLSDKEYNSKDVDEFSIVQHILWMCDEATRFLEHPVRKDAELTKAHRWLGYIQGELRGLNYFSVNELRDHSRDGAQHLWLLLFKAEFEHRTGITWNVDAGNTDAQALANYPGDASEAITRYIEKYDLSERKDTSANWGA